MRVKQSLGDWTDKVFSSKHLVPLYRFMTNNTVTAFILNEVETLFAGCALTSKNGIKDVVEAALPAVDKALVDGLVTRLLEERSQLSKIGVYLNFLDHAIQHELEITQIAKKDGWALVAEMEGADRVSKDLLKRKAFVKPSHKAELRKAEAEVRKKPSRQSRRSAAPKAVTPATSAAVPQKPPDYSKPCRKCQGYGHWAFECKYQPAQAK